SIFSVDTLPSTTGQVVIDTGIQNWPYRPNLVYTPPTPFPAAPIDFSYKLYDSSAPQATAKVHVGFRSRSTFHLVAGLNNLIPDDGAGLKTVKQGILDVQGTAKDLNNSRNFVTYLLYIYDGYGHEVKH